MRESIERIRALLVYPNPYPFMLDDFKKKITEIHYRELETQSRIWIVTPDRREGVACRFVNNGIEAVYAEDLGVTGVFCTDYEKTINGLSDVQSVVSALVEAKPDFYEINYVSRVRPDNHPLTFSTPLNQTLLDRLNSITGMQVRPFSYGVCAYEEEVPTKPLYDVHQWFDARVIPLQHNPQYLKVSIKIRRNSFEGIKSLYKRIPQIIQELVGAVK